MKWNFTGNPEIDTEIDTVDFQQAFLKILVLKYLDGKDGRFDADPMGVILAKQDWIGTEATCLSKLCEDYEITDNANDYVLSNDIETWLKEKKVGISMKRFGMDMKLYCVKNKLENVVSKLKKLRGKPRQVWTGIKLISENDDNDNDD